MGKSVEYLKKRLEKRYEEKERYEEAERKRTERQRLIDSVPDIVETEFYCNEHGDFVAFGGKVVALDANKIPYAYYVSFGRATFLRGLKEGKACKEKRWITDKVFDPYYVKSEALAKLRVELADDLLQPDDPRFRQLYGDPYKKYNEQKELEERAKWEQNRWNSKK